MKYPSTLPVAQRLILERIVDSLSQDQRILAIGGSGSFASNSMDEYSDLDLVIVINPDNYDEVMQQRINILDTIEGKIAAFTGEHVGEPRLIISLFTPGLIHVDFKFVSLSDAAARVDDTQVIWERNGVLTEIYTNSTHHYPQPDIQWIEDRFWVWMHYATGKIARGEYFEALEFLSFLRFIVLSPLALKQHGLTPSGVRWIEKRLPEFSQQLKATVANVNRESLVSAYENVISIYLELRENEQVEINQQAQTLTLEYFKQKLTS
ncbi:nucleotidyltransferase domain-containing protein [Glaciecola sp. 1036]|uniref:nucleotidyltransferase domain-containing protein n=1 Tax=Alteromonadaceae TaxID=72275 RepID=UPI003D0820DF